MSLLMAGSVLKMTQQYIVGELSALIAGLTPERCPRLAVAVHELRRRVECAPLCGLSPLVTEAMALADAACWTSLEEGDADAFIREATEAAILREFASCAGLLP